MRRTLFFDLDGTILDTAERQYHVFSTCAARCGIEVLVDREEFWVGKRNGMRNLDLLAPGTPPDRVTVFRQAWMDLIEDRESLRLDSPFEGIQDALGSLAVNNDLLLTTLRQSRSNLEWQLDHWGLARYFRSLLVGHPTSPQDKARLICDYLRSRTGPGESVLIGDSEMDIQTGVQLGFTTIACAYGQRTAERLRAHHPDHMAWEARQISHVIANLDPNPGTGT
jgi:phosphoglycolate phosphatase